MNDGHKVNGGHRVNDGSFSDEVYSFVSTRDAQRLFGAVFHRHKGARLLSKDDLLQDMALRCLEQAHHFHGGNVEAWASTVAHRVLLNELRRPRYKAIEVEYEQRATDPRRYHDPESLAVTMHTAAALWRGCSQLDRDALVSLVRNAGDTPAVARDLGLNKNTAHGRRKRVRAQLTALTEG